MGKRLTFTATIHNDTSNIPVTVVGREAWTLLHLINAGAKGVRPIDRPAPRWSGYVMPLREAGFNIETVREEHGGTFSGQHGRYILHSRVTVAGGNLADWLSSPEGKREFRFHRFFASEVAA
tara:strand:+ start:1455 stop:1820 length:366 start_codon:yes stop_codon:yes gene_type:complete